MTAITSHAQNSEDIILWRALKTVKDGYYIDIGAQHPTFDSVSKGFYDLGWIGIDVEPVPAYAALLEADRPKNTVLNFIISDINQDTLFEVENTGLSTVRTDLAKHYGSIGFRVVERPARSMTLAGVFDLSGDRAVHWLKIDAEGAEASVLRSWEKHTKRPWIIVIESTMPRSTDPTYAEWESELTSRGYDFVYFDGLNRFYLHASASSLRHHFGPGPNLLDEAVFSVTATNPLVARLREAAAANQQSEDLRREVDRLHLFITTLQASRSWKVARILSAAYWTVSSPRASLAAILRHTLGNSRRRETLIWVAQKTGTLSFLLRVYHRVTGQSRARADLTLTPPAQLIYDSLRRG